MMKHTPSLYYLGLFIALFLMAGCNGRDPEIITNTPEPSLPTSEPLATNDPEAPYPVATQESAQPDAGYPAPTTDPDLLAVPPDPVREFPETPSDRGVVGGVLVRQVIENGYLPVMPVALGLGVYLENDRGEPTLIRYNETSPHAQLFNTGVFLFTDIEPGIYALVIDLGFTKFVIQDDNGYDLVVEVEAGKALDLGQVFVRLPQD